MASKTFMKTFGCKARIQARKGVTLLVPLAASSPLTQGQVSDQQVIEKEKAHLNKHARMNHHYQSTRREGQGLQYAIIAILESSLYIVIVWVVQCVRKIIDTRRTKVPNLAQLVFEACSKNMDRDNDHYVGTEIKTFLPSWGRHLGFQIFSKTYENRKKLQKVLKNN